VSLTPEQLSRLLDSHWGPLLAWVGSTADAEDIVQQTFVALASLAQAPDNPRAWLYKVSKNKAVNAYKSSERRRARQRIASRPEQVAADANSTAEASELNSFLGQLTEEQRAVVAAKIWGQLTFDEIAVHQGISKATAWRIYKTAIESLRAIYDVSCEATR